VSTTSETIKRLRAELVRLAEENIRLERALKLAGPKHPSNPADRPAGGGPTSTGGPHQRKGSKPMTEPEDYPQEEEAKPFNVADHLDEPAVIEAYIGDLQVKIEQLRERLADIIAIAIPARE